jgi:hypothetical protein
MPRGYSGATPFAQFRLHRPVTPLEARVEAIATSLRETPGDLTAGAVMGLLGATSHTVAILVLAVLNMIPGPPGYGGTVAIAMMGVTLAMLLGWPMRLDGWIGRRKLSHKLVVRVVDRLVMLARLIGRVSKPRLEWLAGDAVERPTGCFILLVCLPMVIPIPLINAVPNVGIAVISVSRVNRDGVGVMVGGVIALIGLAIAVAAVWAVVHFGRSVLGL